LQISSHSRIEQDSISKKGVKHIKHKVPGEPAPQTPKGKTNLAFTEANDSEWQWHQLGHMQVCTSLQTDNHASTPTHSFLQAGYPSGHPNQKRQSTEGTAS